MISARGIALAALKIWRTDKRFADAIISQQLAKSNLGQADRAFALELFYGVLRNLTLLDFWIGQMRHARQEAVLRDILRLGLHQLFLLETPPHAAVHEAVELAAEKHRPVVNAVLRRAVRDRKQLRQLANEQPLHVRWSHPEFLLTRWRKNLGEDGMIDLCCWNNRPPPVYARVNRLKISPEQFVHKYPGSFILPNRANFIGWHTFDAMAAATGDCYVQDPSTVMACDLLDPKPGENILDVCAAPGGKTGYLAEKMANHGALLACDRDRGRIERLRENLSQLGIQIAKVVEHDWTKPSIPAAIRSSARFDRILVDAPCTNTGVMRRRVDVRWRLRLTDFLSMQQQQLAILKNVTRLLKPDGVLVYSTCSIEPEENEQVAQQIAKTAGLRAGPETQLLPFRDHFDGAFAARFVKPR